MVARLVAAKGDGSYFTVLKQLKNELNKVPISCLEYKY